MCSAAELSDKEKFPTFGRTFAVDSQVGPSLVSLLKYTYNWTLVAVIYQDTNQWTSLKDHLLLEFKKNGIEVVKQIMVINEAVYHSLEAEEEFSGALRDLKDKARSKYMQSNKNSCILRQLAVGFSFEIQSGCKARVYDVGRGEGGGWHKSAVSHVIFSQPLFVHTTF